MNRSRSSTLLRFAPILIVVLTVIPLAVPYLQPGYQFADDRFAPYLRVEALRSALAEGQFPPRWFADFDGGYGSPYPMFYAMLFYGVAAAFTVAGMSVGAAIELTAFLAIAAAALAMFVLVRSLWGDRSGILAAVLYTYAPYHLVDAFVRGALSELAAFVWFPLIVYTTYQAIESRQVKWLLLSGLTIGGLILTHNLMPIVFLPVILGLLGVIGVLRSPGARSRWTAIAVLGGAAALGLLVSAYFWLPIVFERGLLRLEYFLQYDYHGDFVGRGTLFAWSSGESPHTSIGLILVGAGILGALTALWRASRSSHKAIAVSALGAGLFFLFMTTRRSVWIWDHVPLLAFVQFPWRFLAPASFCLALAAGPLPRVFRSAPVGWIAVVLLGATACWQSSPLIRIARRIDGPTLAAMPICQEVWGTQDYRPATSSVPFWTGPQPPGDPNDPLVLTPCPAGIDLTPKGAATILSSFHGGIQWEIRYAASDTSVIILPQFFFPGWRARLDGELTAVAPSQGTGLLQISLPAGDHVLLVEYGNTPVRRVGNAVSVVGMAVTAATAWLAWRNRSAESAFL